MSRSAEILRPGERLILASNRLPVVLEKEDGRIQATMSSGGLASGLREPHRMGGGPWIGWPGTISDEDGLDPDLEQALGRAGMVGVPLSEREHEEFYNSASNESLWPLFHSLTERFRFSRRTWRTYVDVNLRFAETILAHAEPGDLVFVQDYHLMLVPGILRKARPELRIGFFLHIPFPPAEVFQLLPARTQVLEGLLGADMIGFHTLEYLRHFRHALLRILGLESEHCMVCHPHGKTRLLAQPLGIDVDSWTEAEETPEVRAELDELFRLAGGRKVFLGVDRMDYTKGIPARLLALEEFLDANPGRAEEMMMIQVAVPSRTEVEEYQALRSEVDQIAGRINSRFGRPGFQPLHYLFQSVPKEVLAALYRLADVAVVTPLRDGLNLVAKEYVASRERDDGVLILSEFAGVAWELGEALRVNPLDRDGLVLAFERALAMPPEEQARRMAPMRERVRRNDIHKWTEACLAAIRDTPDSVSVPALLEGATLNRLAEEWKQAERRLLLLDYDGTLREFEERYENAEPTEELLELLRGLGEAPQTRTWIVSGRPPTVLERWFPLEQIGLVAEHGAFMRAPGSDLFQRITPEVPGDWKTRARQAMEEFTDRVPGSHVEEKPLGIAWHFRGCEPATAVWQARELNLHLGEVLQADPVEVLRGNMVLEVRPSGVSKDKAVERILRAEGRGCFVLAGGDDTTDESTFRQLPPDALSILVGRRPSAARFRLPTPAAFRALLCEWTAALNPVAR